MSKERRKALLEAAAARKHVVQRGTIGFTYKPGEGLGPLPPTCWLIERGQTEGYQQAHWLMESGGWTHKAHDAIKFPTRDVATEYAKLAHIEDYSVTEHSFDTRIGRAVAAAELSHVAESIPIEEET